MSNKETIHSGNRPADSGRRSALRLLAGLGAATFGVAVIGLGAAQAQTGSAAALEGPVSMIVPFAPAGETDVIARLVAPELSKHLGVPVVVENRAGAGGTIGLRHVQNISPNLREQTLLVGSTSTQILAPLMNPQNVGFNPVEDMVPVAMLGTYYTVLLTSASSDVKSIEDLRKKANEPLFFGSPGANSEGHLLQLLVAERLGAKNWEHVAYEGAGPTMTALIGKEIHLGVASPVIARGFVENGTLRALAVTSSERSPLFPDVPTLQEAGVDLVAMGFFGLIGPTGMSEETADKIASAAVLALETPALRDRMSELGLLLPESRSRAEFLEIQRGHYKRFETLAPGKAASPG